MTEVHPGWLRHVADGRHQPSAALPEPEPWTAEGLGEAPRLDGAAILDDDGVLLAWLHQLIRFGLGRLRNTPATDRLPARAGAAHRPDPGHQLRRAVHRPGPSRDGADSTAYTGLRLGQHTDLPTRETPPGFQFLHCIENTVAGGGSRMTDGLTVVDELRRRYPDDHDALTTLRLELPQPGRRRGAPVGRAHHRPRLDGARCP